MANFIYELHKNARAGGGRRECQRSRPCGSSLRRTLAQLEDAMVQHGWLDREDLEVQENN